MSEILAVTPEQRPVLGYVLARIVPLLEHGNTEHRESAANLRYTVAALDGVPPGAGEVELQRQDLYFVGINWYLATVDLEEYWLDRLCVARGGIAAEPVPQPAVLFAVGKYFPHIDRDPAGWDFRTVQPAFIDLGMKIDALLTADAPRARGIYNKERSTIVRTEVERQHDNKAKRTVGGLPLAVALGQIGPGSAGVPAAALPPGTAQTAVAERPVGTAKPPARVAPGHLTTVQRATYPGAYQWGVEVGTGVNAGELALNQPRKINVGGAELMLVNTGDKVCAANRVCPHRQWDLTRGGKVEDGVITCGLHGARYNVCSGEVKREPYDPAYENKLSGLSGAFDPKHKTEPMQTYPTRVADDGEVMVHI